MNTSNLLVSVLMLVSVLFSACAPAVPATKVPTSLPPTAAPTAILPPAVATTTTIPDKTFQSSIFEVPVSFTHGLEWAVHEWAKNAIDIVYKDQWGTGMLLVNGALVHDPADMASAEPASADRTKFVPFPADYFAYITSLPGVEVIQGPEPVTIGGVQGSQIIVHTPAMHPVLWLKDDFTWLGGGASGVEPEFKRQMILLEVNGERVLLEFDDSPDKFDERYPLVQEIFNSITFGK